MVIGSEAMKSAKARWEEPDGGDSARHSESRRPEHQPAGHHGDRKGHRPHSDGQLVEALDPLRLALGLGGRIHPSRGRRTTRQSYKFPFTAFQSPRALSETLPFVSLIQYIF